MPGLLWTIVNAPLARRLTESCDPKRLAVGDGCTVQVAGFQEAVLRAETCELFNHLKTSPRRVEIAKWPQMQTAGGVWCGQTATYPKLELTGMRLRKVDVGGRKYEEIVMREDLINCTGEECKVFPNTKREIKLKKSACDTKFDFPTVFFGPESVVPYFADLCYMDPVESSLYKLESTQNLFVMRTWDGFKVHEDHHPAINVTSCDDSATCVISYKNLSSIIFNSKNCNHISFYFSDLLWSQGRLVRPTSRARSRPGPFCSVPIAIDAAHREVFIGKFRGNALVLHKVTLLGSDSAIKATRVGIFSDAFYVENESSVLLKHPERVGELLRLHDRTCRLGM
jgi:hypothetical protein